MFEAFFDLFTEGYFATSIDILFSLTWLWLPIVLGFLFFELWIRYVRTEYVEKQGEVLLELRLPKEMAKSPAAMEIVIASMAQPSVGSYIDVYLKGRVRPWFSLELVSIGGQVRFYVWMQKKWKSLIESQVYSQFPSIEIHEVEDYTKKVHYDPAVISLWGMQLELTKADAYPIKTYVEYGLDKDPKEEYKIDPITPVLEYLGSLKPHQQVWIQILIQAHKKENLKDLRIKEKPNWKKDVEKEMKKIIEEQSLVDIEDEKGPNLQGLTDVQKEIIKAMQRNLGKTAFETAIRGIYLAPSDAFDPNNIGGLTGVFKQFGSENLNGFKPKLTTSFDYPWQDFRGKRLASLKEDIFDAYRRRSFFQLPYKHFEGKPFILTTEELATLFHFPGEVAATPTLTRTPSKKAEAPGNLPI